MNIKFGKGDMRVKVLFICCVIPLFGFSQNIVKEYFSSPYIDTANPEESQFYCIGYKDRDGKWKGIVKSFYTKTNNLRSEGFYKNDFLEGEYIQYYENGKKEMICTYKNGRKLGKQVYFYPNGLFHKEVFYPDDYYEEDSPDILILHNYSDSIGNKLVVDGLGRGKFYTQEEVTKENGQKELNIYWEEGNYRNGLKEGTWTGTFQCGTFEESYSAGLLNSGKSRDKSGTEYTYSKVLIPPGYGPGMVKFYQQVSNKMKGKYPREARRSGIEGKVYIAFTIEKDGSRSDIHVVKGIGYGCDEVALEAIQSLKQNWTPSIVRGVEVKQKMILPLFFKLS